MKLAAAYGPGRFGLSFEVYPPKSPAGEAQLFGALEELAAFRPAFVSCTFGAGGSTRDRTLELTGEMQRRFGITATAHRTCVESSAEEIRAWLARAEALGIKNIMALRGDPPQGEPTFQRPPGGFAHADELVALIRREFPGFGVAVAGYPETHREAPSPEVDLANLKRKVAAGADVVITQLFYDNRHFFAFRERYRQAGIAAPLVPGILPVISLSQIQRIASLCGATLPPALLAELVRWQDDPVGQMEAGVAQAVAQCRELLASGIPGLHFYVLNRAEAPRRILESLGLPR